jgi:hypothetical protein
MSKSLNLYGGAVLGSVAMLTAAYNFADRNVTPMPDEARLLGEAPGNPDIGFMIRPAVASTTPAATCPTWLMKASYGLPSNRSGVINSRQKARQTDILIPP